MDQELLYRYLNGETTSEEEQRILEWLDADPVNHPKELDAVRYICIAADFGILSKMAQPRRRVWPLRRIVSYVSGIAAALLLLVGANYLGRERTLNDISARMTTMEVPAGQRIKMVLEDGSQVWLNAGTRFEYPAVFGQGQRRVKLSGEAMFEVRHEQKRPFIVETFASEVEVLGTKFNVIADQAESRFSTALLDGSVKVVDLNSHETIYMQPNDVVNLINGHLVKDKICDPVTMQWTEGLLSIRGLTFPELMSKFEKAYGVKIEIRCRVMPIVEIGSGKIRVSDGIDHALRVLQLAADFTYTKDMENNMIVIR